MNAIRVALLTIGSAALINGTGYAASSGPASQQASPDIAVKATSGTPHRSQHVAGSDRKGERDARTSEQRSLRSLVKNRTLSQESLTRVNRPKQIPNSERRSTPASVVSPHRTGPVLPAGTGRGGFTQSGAANTPPAIPQRVAIRPAKPLFASLRHRGANPPAIGGAANSVRTNSATDQRNRYAPQALRNRFV